MLLEVNMESHPVQETVLESPKKEVNRFVGWAIYSLGKRLKAKHDKENAEGEDEPSVVEEMNFLDSMSIKHCEAISMPGYMANCYEPLDVMYNLGGLTLVAPDYFDFGLALVKAVGEALSEDLIKRDGNKSMVKARKTVQANKSITQQFLECSKDCSLEESRKLRVLEWLVEKTCNARFSAVINLFKDHETGRRGDRKSDTSLRAPMK
jgi:hypothetical protein